VVKPAVALLLPALAACAPGYVPGPGDDGPQAYYRTGYPQRDTSREIERILRSVKRIQVTGHYETFAFAPESSVTRAALAEPATYARATSRQRFSRTKTGTATAIARAGDRLRLVTAEHATRWPDTVVAYFDTGERTPARGASVASVAILRSQTTAILGVPGASTFDVVARDTLDDIALISAQVSASPGAADVPTLRAPVGDPARLAWGSFVYVLGYPRGYAMVTRAIVSDPRRDSDNGFLLDGLFNRGISGGLVLAVRGDTGALELVGLATAAAANAELMLVPDRRAVEEDGVVLPYRGDLFIEQVARIEYGITFSAPMTAVARFLRASGVRVGGPD
jgi:hypothetical protein